ncbi:MULTISPECIES: S1 family peptidase [Streptomyces]|uniref:S1 family peptidase n=1 Tax=Streptomyces TaxID=1883 RepID=UPI00345BECF8
MQKGLMEEQSKLDRAADRIVDAAKKEANSGYAGIRVSAERRELQLYWHGNKPKLVADVLEKLKPTVKVVEIPARYTEAALKVEAARIIKEGDSTIGGKSNIVGAGPREDGSGVWVGVASLPKENSNRAKMSAAETSTRLAAGRTEIPLFLEKQDKPQQLSRKDQQANAGAYFSAKSKGSSWCSTAFTIEENDFIVRKRFALTAAHCVDRPGDTVHSWNRGYFAGVSHTDRTEDLALLETEADFFQPYMFHGGWAEDSGSQNLRAVAGSSKNYVGDRVCTSGSASGTICDIQVTATNRMAVTDDGNFYPMVIAQKLDGGAAAGTGDSGGPVFSYADSNYVRITARGIISSGSGNSVPCKGMQGRTCKSQLAYLDIEDALNKVKEWRSSNWITISTA